MVLVDGGGCAGHEGHGVLVEGEVEWLEGHGVRFKCVTMRMRREAALLCLFF